jgi:hypothetical protein
MSAVDRLAWRAAMLGNVAAATSEGDDRSRYGKFECTDAHGGMGERRPRLSSAPRVQPERTLRATAFVAVITMLDVIASLRSSQSDDDDPEEAA